jgi:hypothetical protein
MLALMVRAMRDLAALTDRPEEAEVKPRWQPYAWKPGW